MTTLAAVIPAAALAQDAAENEPANETIVVTATRQEATLATVPLSVQAFSQASLEASGVKQFDDLIRLSPGLTLNESNSSGSNNIAIRGIASDAGAATTGIYINDVPVAVRNIGYGAAAPFPNIFDLERVEVLRGPQGTLFGSGSEGGTVRFILSQPDLDEADGHARAELASTDGGELSYETSAAFGAPIIEDKLAFRASASYRRQGGYIDRVRGTLDVIDPTGLSGPSSGVFDIEEVLHEDNNWDAVQAYRLALTASPTPDLKITPWITYQKEEFNDRFSNIWLSASDPDDNYFAAPIALSVPGVGLADFVVPELPEGATEYTVSALEVEWNAGDVNVFSTTSFLNLDKSQWYDFTNGYVWWYTYQFPTPDGWRTMAEYQDKSRVFQQEIRFQSDFADQRFEWLAGAFYSNADQYSAEPIYSNWFDLVDSWFGIPNLDGASPFGPGSTNGQNIWGYEPGPNGLNYDVKLSVEEQQFAGFGQLAFHVTDRLTLTAGVRVSQNEFSIDSVYEGWENNGAAPFGADCPVGETCTFGDPDGPFAPIFPGGVASSSETSTTPKFTIAYDLTDDTMLYGNVAKGFRPGGGQALLPAVCDAGLTQLGYLDQNGNPITPETFESDSVWNYEVGVKSTLLGGRLFVDANVYQIKWEGVQSQVSVPICGYGFVDNLGEATSEGVDFATQLRVTDSFNLGLALAHNESTFDSDVVTPDGGVLYSGGTPLPDAGRPLTASISGDYDGMIARLPIYGHVDVTYQSEFEEFGSTDPNSVAYNPLVKPDGESTLVNLRFGAYVGNADISLFINNVTDEQPDGYSSSNAENIGNAAAITARTFRPRTIGVTATVRY